jgi:uncharacterized membrane protein YfcA
VLAYALISLDHSGSIAPAWIVGIAMGLGGLGGGYVGAGLQSRLPEMLLRRGLGVLAFGLAIRYLVLGLG